MVPKFKLLAINNQQVQHSPLSKIDLIRGQDSGQTVDL